MKPAYLLCLALAALVFVFTQNCEAMPQYRIKRVSDQRLAEIETLLGLHKLRGQSNNDSPMGLSIDRIGKRYDSFQQKEQNSIRTKYKRHIPSGRGPNGSSNVSELRLAELETLNKLYRPAHDIDFHKIGRKRRSQSPLLDAIFNRYSEPDVNYEDLYKKR